MMDDVLDSPMPAPPPLKKYLDEEELLACSSDGSTNNISDTNEKVITNEKNEKMPAKHDACINNDKESEDKENVKVFLRLRPRVINGKFEFGKCVDDALLVKEEENSVQTIAPKNSQAFKNRETGGKFSFSKVFDKGTSQSELFESTTENLANTFLKGKDALLFAYGVTNAGKTYTVEGTEEQPGLIPRTLQLLFDKLEGQEIKLTISYLQVYNEQIHDLQQPQTASKFKKNLKIIMRDEGVEVENLIYTDINTCQEGLDIINRGRELRNTNETMCNVSSSRSHSVFVIQMGHDNAANKSARFYIVDLAGSERGKRTMASRVRQKEASNINCSLMNLMRCLDTLRLNQKNKKVRKESKQKMVPFRESKLTQLFRDCFVGENCGGVAMIINASSCPDDYDETAHALKYGALVKSVEVARGLKSKLPKRPSLYGFNGRRLGRTNTADSENEKTPSGKKFGIIKQKNNVKGTPNSSFKNKGSFKKNKYGSFSSQRGIDKLKSTESPNNSPPKSVGGEDSDWNTESEEAYEFDEDDIPGAQHPIISALVYELADARMKCITMEQEIRDEVSNEMASRLEEMEAVFMQRVNTAKNISQSTSENLLANIRNLVTSNSNDEEDLYSIDSVIKEFETEMSTLKDLHATEKQVLERKIKDLEEKNKKDEKTSNKKESKRKSLERLDEVMGKQLTKIERYDEELKDEKAMHEKTNRQLEMMTQLKKDTEQDLEENQHELAAVEQHNVALRLELDQLKSEIMTLKRDSTTSIQHSNLISQENIVPNRSSASNFMGSPLKRFGSLKSIKSKQRLGPSKLNKHNSAPGVEDQQIILQETEKMNNIRTASADNLTLNASPDQEEEEVLTSSKKTVFKVQKQEGNNGSFKSGRSLVSRMVGIMKV